MNPRINNSVISVIYYVLQIVVLTFVFILLYIKYFY